MSFDLVVRGGLVITAEQALVADVAVAGERIAAIGRDLHGAVELDARGLYVIPGAVDGHVHLTDPTFPPYAALTAEGPFQLRDCIVQATQNEDVISSDAGGGPPDRALRRPVPQLYDPSRPLFPAL